MQKTAQCGFLFPIVAKPKIITIKSAFFMLNLTLHIARGIISVRVMRGRAVVARQAHNLEAVGSNPTPAT